MEVWEDNVCAPILLMWACWVMMAEASSAKPVTPMGALGALSNGAACTNETVLKRCATVRPSASTITPTADAYVEAEVIVVKATAATSMS